MQLNYHYSHLLVNNYKHSNLSAMIKTEEKIIRINRRKQGEEVRVYQTFDKETGKPIGGSRFTHLHETDSEEVKNGSCRK